jgi:hypothetical protein
LWLECCICGEGTSTHVCWQTTGHFVVGQHTHSISLSPLTATLLLPLSSYHPFCIFPPHFPPPPHSNHAFSGFLSLIEYYISLYLCLSILNYPTVPPSLSLSLSLFISVFLFSAPSIYLCLPILNSWSISLLSRTPYLFLSTIPTSNSLSLSSSSFPLIFLSPKERSPHTFKRGTNRTPPPRARPLLLLTRAKLLPLLRSGPDYQQPLLLALMSLNHSLFLLVSYTSTSFIHNLQQILSLLPFIAAMPLEHQDQDSPATKEKLQN